MYIHCRRLETVLSLCKKTKLTDPFHNMEAKQSVRPNVRKLPPEPRYLDPVQVVLLDNTSKGTVVINIFSNRCRGTLCPDPLDENYQSFKDCEATMGSYRITKTCYLTKEDYDNLERVDRKVGCGICFDRNHFIQNCPTKTTTKNGDK